MLMLLLLLYQVRDRGPSRLNLVDQNISVSLLFLLLLMIKMMMILGNMRRLVWMSMMVVMVLRHHVHIRGRRLTTVIIISPYSTITRSSTTLRMHLCLM